MAKGYFYINKKMFEKLKERALKAWNTEFHGESKNEAHLFENMELSDSHEIYFEDGKLYMNGTMLVPDEKGKLVDIGWISLEFGMGLELANQVIQEYVKKLNKIKTVIEAVK